MYKSLGDVFRSVSRPERAIVAACAIAVIVITCLPPIFGFVAARNAGTVFSGKMIWSGDDLGVYLSYISQAKRGALAFANEYTTEPLVPVVNVLWLAVGLLARVADLTPLAAYHAARVALIPALAAAAYLLIAYLLRPRAWRLAAFVLFMFGSGAGALLEPLFPVPVRMRGGLEWPTDLWVPESNPFMSMMYSAHFTASWALMLFILLLLFMAMDRSRPRYAVAAGMLGSAFFQFHPYYVPTMYALCLAYAGYVHARKRREEAGGRPWTGFPWASCLSFFALSSPPVAYHYWLTHFAPNRAFMMDANLTLTPPLPYVLIGFGMLVIGAAVGWRIGRRDPTSVRALDFAVLWALLLVLLAYSPINFQRRLLEGLQFPLAVLAAPALVAAAAAFKKEFPRGRMLHAGAALAAVLILSLSNISAVSRHVRAYWSGRDGSYFFTAEEDAAMRWLREGTPAGSIVAADVLTANALCGWGERPVYAGHWSNTNSLDEKSALLERYFTGEMTVEERKEFLADAGIDFVYWGPREREFGGPSPAAAGGVSSEYRSENIEIFKVIPQ